MKKEPYRIGATSLSTDERAGLYNILSQCYFAPDESLLRNLKNSGFLGQHLLKSLGENIIEKDGLRILSLDFSRLFLGPFKPLALPYGSVYLDNRAGLMGDSTVKVNKFYQGEGLEASLREVPDHIAMELEFMYYLVVKEACARHRGNNEWVDYRRKQFFFLSAYLGSWVPEFAACVKKNARTEFYRVLARVTQLFIEDDLEALTTHDKMSTSSALDSKSVIQTVSQLTALSLRGRFLPEAIIS